jgi:hypothetical protein
MVVALPELITVLPPPWEKSGIARIPKSTRIRQRGILFTVKNIPVPGAKSKRRRMAFLKAGKKDGQGHVSGSRKIA